MKSSLNCVDVGRWCNTRRDLIDELKLLLFFFWSNCQQFVWCLESSQCWALITGQLRHFVDKMKKVATFNYFHSHWKFVLGYVWIIWKLKLFSNFLMEILRLHLHFIDSTKSNEKNKINRGSGKGKVGICLRLCRRLDWISSRIVICVIEFFLNLTTIKFLCSCFLLNFQPIPNLWTRRTFIRYQISSFHRLLRENLLFLLSILPMGEFRSVNGVKRKIYNFQLGQPANRPS